MKKLPRFTLLLACFAVIGAAVVTVQELSNPFVLNTVEYSGQVEGVSATFTIETGQYRGAIEGVSNPFVLDTIPKNVVAEWELFN